MRPQRLFSARTFSLLPNRTKGRAPILVILAAVLSVCLCNGATRLQAQQNEWTWVGGNSSLVGSGGAGGQAGVYGTLGTASASNAPGGRSGSSTWTDSNGNFWLFGGQGFDATDALGNLNDLWMFNPSTTQWTWISGSSTVGATGAQSGVYGTLGTAAASNHPGGRYEAMSWIDSSGNLWLFGGFGYDANGTHSDLNDLWEFSPSTKQWTWMGGSTVSGGGYTGYGPGQPGVYGTLGSAAAGNIPGGRGSGSTWTDNSGNFWLFGGWGYDTAGNGGALNDLWEFSPTTKQWTWRGGSSTVGTSGGLPGMGGLAGVYGTQGTAATGNLPGSRSSAIAWKDHSGNFWLFGGEGVDGSGNGGYLNDLWEFSPTTGEWTWVGGSSTVGSNQGQAGVYGTLGTAAAGNIPGGRSSASSWTDSSGNLWLEAGYGFDSAGRYGYPNDVWEFNPTTK